MKRSPRQGWTLVELVDGRWNVNAKGDREALKFQRDAKVSAILRTPGLHHPGCGVALYDAHGQRRDGYPTFPRLADGTRIEYPATTPDDGAVPVVFVPRVRAGAVA